MITRLKQFYEKWIFNAYLCTSSQLGLFRIAFIFILIFFVGVPQFSNKIINFPDGFYNPPPFFGQIFSDIPPILYFRITDIILYLGFFCTLIGLFTKVSGITSASLTIINFGFIFSTGKIDHSFILWFTLFIMSFSGWEKNFSIDSIIFNTKNIKVQTWLFSLLSLSLGFAFFTAGLIKLISGWLGTADSMVRAFFLRNYYVQQKQEYLANFFENLNFQLFWEIGDWFTVFFEIGFLAVVFQVSLFRFFTLLAIFFHGMVMLMMNISFSAYFSVYLLFWTPLIPNKIVIKIQDTFHKLTQNRTRLLITILILFIFYSVRIAFNEHVYSIFRDALILCTFIMSLYIFIIKPKILFLKSGNQIETSIIKFDGVCNLCNGFVQFVINRDKSAHFKFSTLQDSYDDKKEFQTIIFQNNEVIYEKSTAFLEIARKLNGLWPYLYLFILIPKPIRDFIYSIIAKNRYHWFGKREICMIPTPELKNRFIL